MVAGVGRVGQGVQQVLVAGWAAAVLGWTGPGAVDDGVGVVRTAGADVLQGDGVDPAVAEVVGVGVGESVTGFVGDRDQPFTIGADFVAGGRAGVDDGVFVDVEGVQMSVVPAHGILDHQVCLVEPGVGRYRHAPPYQRVGVVEFDLEDHQRRVG